MESGCRWPVGRGHHAQMPSWPTRSSPLAWLSALRMVGLVGIFGAPRPWRAFHGFGDDGRF